jgi:hypothetical protein
MGEEEVSARAMRESCFHATRLSDAACAARNARARGGFRGRQVLL